MRSRGEPFPSPFFPYSLNTNVIIIFWVPRRGFKELKPITHSLCLIGLHKHEDVFSYLSFRQVCRNWTTLVGGKRSHHCAITSVFVSRRGKMTTRQLAKHWIGTENVAGSTQSRSSLVFFLCQLIFFCQGAIFLYYDGRIKQVQGILVEVSTFMKLITLQFPLDSFYGYFCAGIYVGSPDFSDARIIM